MTGYHHESVLLREVVDAIAPADGEVYVDCTLGGGGIRMRPCPSISTSCAVDIIEWAKSRTSAAKGSWDIIGDSTSLS